MTELENRSTTARWGRGRGWEGPSKATPGIRTETRTSCIFTSATSLSWSWYESSFARSHLLGQLVKEYVGVLYYSHSCMGRYDYIKSLIKKKKKKRPGWFPALSPTNGVTDLMQISNPLSSRSPLAKWTMPSETLRKLSAIYEKAWHIASALKTAC